MDTESPAPQNATRISTTAWLVTIGLSLAAIVAFFRETPGGIHPLTETLISNFTTIVGIVVAFYFSSCAYAQAKAKAAKDPQ